MDHKQFKAARLKLGLSPSDMGRMLGAPDEPMTRQRVLNYERPPKEGQPDKVNTVVKRLMLLYLSGVRPEDWPTSKED